MTAVTMEKTKMQIPVTNQKTKSMRPASRDAELGSQSGTSATADATAPARTPITISWTIEPLRTDVANLLDAGPSVQRFPHWAGRDDVRGRGPSGRTPVLGEHLLTRRPSGRLVAFVPSALARRRVASRPPGHPRTSP